MGVDDMHEYSDTIEVKVSVKASSERVALRRIRRIRDYLTVSIGERPVGMVGWLLDFKATEGGGYGLQDEGPLE